MDVVTVPVLDFARWPQREPDAKNAPLAGNAFDVDRTAVSRTMPLLIESPRPVPWPTGLVVKNGSKTCGRCSAGMPQPLSEKTRQMPWHGSARVVTRIVPPALDA